jgi:peptide/nickel transport system substrate-binding protein
MKRKSIFILIAVLIVFAVAATVITAQESNIPKPRNIEGTVITERPIVYEKGSYGGTMTAADYAGDPKTFNGTQANETSSTDLINRFHIYLVDFNDDTGEWFVIPGDESKGSAGPGYDMEVTDDGKQILTFYLRKDIYWTDGARMTADDWVYYWNTIECNEDIYTPGYPGTWVTLEDGSEEQIKAEKVNRYTFRFVYPRIIGEPELQASFQPMPKHIIQPEFEDRGAEGIAQLWGLDTPVENIVGNGPWVLTKYEQGSTTVFERNERYFEKDEWNNRLPYLDKWVNKITADLNATLNLFKGKEVDFYGVDNKNFKQIVEDAEAEGYTVYNGGPATGFSFMSFNQNPDSELLKGTPKLGWFTNRDFREAMSLLIDREAIITQVYDGLAEPDTTYFHKASHYFDSNVQFTADYNVKKAQSLLEGIGIRDRNGDGIAEDADGNNIEFEITTNSGNTTRENIISIVSNEWNTYGISATPSPIDFNVLVGKLLDSFDWECVMISLTGGQFPLTGENVYPHTGNLHMWNPKQDMDNPASEWEKQVTDLFYQAKYEPDFETRKYLLNEMFSIMYEQYPFIPLVRQYSFLAIYDEWKNVKWDVWNGLGGSNNKRLFSAK